ncbi:MAG: restriction endonuclease [Alphaproteobacteria bacterium]|nr:restriction endonuclease [Alphaproteobacteria bacterium]
MTPPPLTSEQLDQMDWAQFERCVVDLIRKTYGEVVEIRQTGHTDGGRDGEGRFTLQAGQLSLNIDVWVEVKQRSRGPLGAKDFGATTFRAVIEPVNKLILATNRTLSAPYRDQLSIFGQRLRIDVTVLEQADIISLSRGADGGSSEPAQGRIRLAPTSPLAVSARLISDPFGPIQKSEIEPDSLAYIMVDVRCDVAGGLCRYDLDVAFTTPPDLGNTPRHVEGVLVGPGFRRHLFAFLPPSGARFSLEEIAKLTASVITEEGAAPLQIVATPSTMSVSRRPLRATSLPYQDKLIDSIVRDMADNGRPPFFLIQASAGAGKSYIVQKLRTMCACQEREVLWLDGEETNTPAGLFRAIVKTCFANTQALIDPECKERFQGWLAENGFSLHQAEALASAALDSWQDFVIPPDVCLDTAALLISKVASLRPFALFFEDLHKVSTTTIDMLRGLLPRVAGVERGVVVVLTSRPTDIRYGDEGKAKIASELLAPLEGVKALQWLRMEPTEAEKVEGARLLLRSALPGLPEWRLSMVDRSMSLAASILEQVGTTPFNIKEALLFLEHEKLVSPRGDGTYDVCDHTAR